MKGTRTNIDVGGVLHTGRELDVRESVILPEFASYRFAAPVRVELRLRRLGRGIDVRGTIEARAQGECARCLETVSLPLQLTVAEQLDPAGDRLDPLAESNVLSDDGLDLDDLARQLIDSALPLALLCADDCVGLCANCGRKRDGNCRCPSPE